MPPESPLKCSARSLCQWRPVVKVEPTRNVAWVLEGLLKERLAASGRGDVKVERWIVRVR